MSRVEIGLGWTQLTSKTVKILEDDIDTDQIVPARFLKTKSARGLGPALFADRRYDGKGHPRADFPLNPPLYSGQSILLAGANFGCGSSREHAPWALREFGFRAIIARSFADIFYNNCLRNGLAAIAIGAREHAHLAATDAIVHVNLDDLRLECGPMQLNFAMDPFARYCLMTGIEAFDYIAQHEPAIAQFEVQRAARQTSVQPA